MPHNLLDKTWKWLNKVDTLNNRGYFEMFFRTFRLYSPLYVILYEWFGKESNVLYMENKTMYNCSTRLTKQRETKIL